VTLGAALTLAWQNAQAKTQARPRRRAPPCAPRSNARLARSPRSGRRN